MICPSCAREIPNESVFCPNCGVSFQSGNQAPPEYNSNPYPPEPARVVPVRKPVSRGVLIAAFVISLLMGNTIAIVLSTLSLIYFERVAADEAAGNMISHNYNIDTIRKLNIAAWVLICLGALAVVAAILAMVFLLLPLIAAELEDESLYYEFGNSMYGIISAVSRLAFAA